MSSSAPATSRRRVRRHILCTAAVAVAISPGLASASDPRASKLGINVNDEDDREFDADSNPFLLSRSSGMEDAAESRRNRLSVHRKQSRRKSEPHGSLDEDLDDGDDEQQEQMEIVAQMVSRELGKKKTSDEMKSDQKKKKNKVADKMVKKLKNDDDDKKKQVKSQNKDDDGKKFKEKDDSDLLAGLTKEEKKKLAGLTKRQQEKLLNKNKDDKSEDGKNKKKAGNDGDADKVNKKALQEAEAFEGMTKKEKKALLNAAKDGEEKLDKKEQKFLIKKHKEDGGWHSSADDDWYGGWDDDDWHGGWDDDDGGWGKPGCVCVEYWSNDGWWGSSWSDDGVWWASSAGDSIEKRDATDSELSQGSSASSFAKGTASLAAGFASGGKKRERELGGKGGKSKSKKKSKGSKKGKGSKSDNGSHGKCKRWECEDPTLSPTLSPSYYPTLSPTSLPTHYPSFTPTDSPNLAPDVPSVKPTPLPTKRPTRSPSKMPTKGPSVPTKIPTQRPSKQPTKEPSRQPTRMPSHGPSRPPSKAPSSGPTKLPTRMPSKRPSSGGPTRQPTKAPSGGPTRQPTKAPSSGPTRQPTKEPTSEPSTQGPTKVTPSPTSSPSSEPSVSAAPSRTPTETPSTSLSPSMSSSPSADGSTGAPTTYLPTDIPTTYSPTGIPTTYEPTLPPGQTQPPSESPTTPIPTYSPTPVPIGAPGVICAVNETVFDPFEEDFPGFTDYNEYEFGSSVAISGTTALVGAPGAVSVTTPRVVSGAAFVFDLVGDEWVQTEKLVPTFGVDVLCGTSVALSGNYAVVGCPDKENNDVVKTGAVYVYKRESADSQFVEVRALFPDNGAAADDEGQFGVSVAINENGFIVVGARAARGGLGAAYLYEPSGEDEWTLDRSFLPEDVTQTTFGNYGWSVAISEENTVLVGAPFEGQQVGAVFIYKEDNFWELPFDIVEFDEAGSLFGFSLAIENSIAVVGARNTRPSRAFVYDVSGSTEDNAVLIQTLDPQITETGALFGDAVAFKDGHLVIGRPGSSGNGNAVYLYLQKGDGSFDEDGQRVVPSSGSGDIRYGQAVAISEGNLMVGAPESDTEGDDSGSLFVYALEEKESCDSASLSPIMTDSISQSSSLEPPMNAASLLEPGKRYTAWSSLNEKEKEVATVYLGYSSETWDMPGTNELEEFIYDELYDNAKSGALFLGLTEEIWDCHCNHYYGYWWDEVADLGLDEALSVLGWDENSWDNADEPAPESENLYWDGLTEEEQAAASQLCYFKELWDEDPIPNWYE